jgi:CBS domain-containing protein
VAAGVDPDTTTVQRVMSAPVFTVPSGLTVDDLVEEIVRGRIRHFVVTEDGTPGTAAEGVISEHDVLKAKGTVPTALIDELHRSRTAEQLRHWRDRAEELLQQYIREEVRMRLVCAVMAKINDALIETALRITLAELDAEGRAPTARFCWLALGSEGREEQLLRTDQDNAIVFASEDGRSDEAIREELLPLGRRVVDILVDAGFARCPGNIMASNPKWVASEQEWRRHFEGWISKPQPKELMYANIFFDLRPVWGRESLATELRSWVMERVHDEPGFFAFFAQSALANPPPLSFFKNMLLEKSGDHKDQFDIKARAMMPLCDAARVLAYHERIADPVNTPERYKVLARTMSGSLERLCKEAAPAYEMFMRFRVREGLETESSGRYIRMKTLTRLEQKSLRNGFSVIEDMQLALRSRFRADFLR